MIKLKKKSITKKKPKEKRIANKTIRIKCEKNERKDNFGLKS